MKLNEKINDRKVAYLFRRDPAIAFELGLLYFVLAKRKNSSEQILNAGRKAAFWLKKAAVPLPEFLGELSAEGQLAEIEKILVLNKAKVDARLSAGVPTTADFGLALN